MPLLSRLVTSAYGCTFRPLALVGIVTPRNPGVRAPSRANSKFKIQNYFTNANRPRRPRVAAGFSTFRPSKNSCSAVSLTRDNFPGSFTDGSSPDSIHRNTVREEIDNISAICCGE
jgi:hypothetical protein